MSLKGDFKERFPEFDNQAVDTAWPGLESLWPCVYGGSYTEGESNCDNEAILYLNAHLFKVDQGSGPAFVSTSKSVGSVSSTSLIDPNLSADKSFFSSTKYGQRYLLLTQHRHGACFV